MTTMNWFLYNLNDVIYFQLESLLYVFKVINPTSHKGLGTKEKKYDCFVNQSFTRINKRGHQ